MDVLTRVT